VTTLREKAVAMEARIRSTPSMADMTDAVLVLDEKDRIIDHQRAVINHQAAEIRFLKRRLTEVGVSR